ncbi:MAG: HAD-IA family hydrolase [Candidatus Omnitrophota bacterium]
MSRLLRRVKAVIFDMDGVITNTMPYHFDAWMETLKAAGIKVDCYDVYLREGQPGLSTLMELSKERGIKLSLAQAKDILLKKEILFKRIVKTRFVKGSRPYLRYLKRRKFLLGLVTGTSRHEARKILHKELFALFDVTVTGDEVAHGKPHPEPFLKALKGLKISPEEALVIENAPLGIEAAKKAGLFCAALETSLPEKYLKKADIICKTFSQLRKSLRLVQPVNNP